MLTDLITAIEEVDCILLDVNVNDSMKVITEIAAARTKLHTLLTNLRARKEREGEYAGEYDGYEEGAKEKLQHEGVSHAEILNDYHAQMHYDGDDRDQT